MKGGFPQCPRVLYLSQCSLHHDRLATAFNPLEPGVKQEVLLSSQTIVLDIKLWTHPHMTVDLINVSRYIVAGNTSLTTSGFIESSQH